MTDYKEATSGDVVKFEKEGDFIEGELVGYEESKQYPDSYAVRVKQADDTIKVVFVSAIAVNLIESNSIMKGQEIKIEFLGKKKTQDGKREYNNYKVLYK